MVVIVASIAETGIARDGEEERARVLVESGCSLDGDADPNFFFDELGPTRELRNTAVEERSDDGWRELACFEDAMFSARATVAFAASLVYSQS
jgi:hypothetical protein